jgi:hypothetical protein
MFYQVIKPSPFCAGIMRINSIIIFLIIVIAVGISTIYSQTDTTNQLFKDYTFSPTIAGGQFEVTTILGVSEIGALIDVDLFRKESTVNYSFGVRLSFESYAYFEVGGPTGGGPFKDYCFFAIHSARSEYFHFNLFGGLAYHTRKSTFYEPNQILPRTGIELRYNLFSKILGIIFKVSTSFKKRTTVVGFGFAFGFYQ